MNLKSYIQILLISLLLFSCSGDELSKEDVEGIWFLKEMEGKEAAYIFGAGLPTVNFDWEQHKIFGTGGCNRYTVNYRLDKDNIKLDSLTSTEALCEDSTMEAQFFQLLNKATKIKVEDDALVFMDGQKVILRFLRLDLSAMANG